MRTLPFVAAPPSFITYFYINIFYNFPCVCLRPKVAVCRQGEAGACCCPYWLLGTWRKERPTNFPLVDRKERNERARRTFRSRRNGERERARRVRSFIQTWDAHFAKGAFNLHSGNARGRWIIHLAASEARSADALFVQFYRMSLGLFNYSKWASGGVRSTPTRFNAGIFLFDLLLFPLDDC